MYIVTPRWEVLHSGYRSPKCLLQCSGDVALGSETRERPGKTEHQKQASEVRSGKSHQDISMGQFRHRPEAALENPEE